VTPILAIARATRLTWHHAPAMVLVTAILVPGLGGDEKKKRRKMAKKELKSKK
jgi:hypothetical protein